MAAALNEVAVTSADCEHGPSVLSVSSTRRLLAFLRSSLRTGLSITIVVDTS